MTFPAGVWACASLALSACMRPAEGRARDDDQVGCAERDGVTIAVEDGAAAVRELSRERVGLWSGAPAWSAELAYALPPPERVSLVVDNCVPGSLLSVGDGQPRPPLAESVGSSCHYQLEPGRENALSLRLAAPGVERSEPFRFAVLSDVQEAIGGIQDIYRLVNREPGVEFLLGAGDLTQQGTHSQLQRFQRELRGLDVPYYTTLGNHELGQYPTLYHQYFGRTSQSFEYRGVRFSLIDSASSTVDPIVVERLDDWMDRAAGRLHVVAMHIPPLDPVGVRNGSFGNRNEAARLLARMAEGGVDMTLYGHIHSYYHFDNAGIEAHVSGGGGAIPERFDDLGRHFLVVDADAEAERLDVRVVRVD